MPCACPANRRAHDLLARRHCQQRPRRLESPPSCPAARPSPRRDEPLSLIFPTPPSSLVPAAMVPIQLDVSPARHGLAPPLMPCATRPRALRGSPMHGRRPCTVVRGPRSFLACPCAARCPDVLRAAPVQLLCVSFVELHQCPRSTTACFYPSSTARRSSLSSPVSARSALKSRVSFARAMRVVHTC
jgi:hypothetical protein